jgi:hypothetical protein
MVQWARSRGIAVAFILLGDNSDQTYQLRQGLDLISVGRYDDAIAKLDAAKQEEEDYSFSLLAQMQLAKAYEAAGRNAEARKALTAYNVFGGLHGGYPIALDSEYHAIMREAGRRFGVPVLDAAAELSKAPELFIDQCHFDGKGQALVAQLVANAIEAARAKR